MLRAVWRREARQLVLVAHHVVIDGVSWRILMEDLATAWRWYVSGAPIDLPPVGTSFRRWTQLLERAAFDADRAYFRRPLPGEDAPWAGARCPRPTPSPGNGRGPCRPAPTSRPRCWATFPRGSTRGSTTCC